MSARNDIFNAAYRNDVKAIREVVAEGVDPNAQHPGAGALPLQLACQSNSLAAIAALLDCGADPAREFTRVSRVDARTFATHVPLMYVQSVQAAKLLLDAGASVEGRDELNWSPLVWDVAAGNRDLVDFLMQLLSEFRGLLPSGIC